MAQEGAWGRYRDTAVERAMKIQEVLLGAMSGEYRRVQAAANMGLSDRQMPQRRERRPLLGMLLQVDTSRHAWLPGGQQDDLVRYPW